MTLQVVAIDIDCDDPMRVATFWSAALGRPVEDGASPFFARLGPTAAAPAMMFLKVPEQKSVKNRVHIDLFADDRQAEVDRLVSLGAAHVADKDEWGYSWAVLTDVEGNEFCIGGPQEGHDPT